MISALERMRGTPQMAYSTAGIPGNTGSFSAQGGQPGSTGYAARTTNVGSATPFNAVLGGMASGGVAPHSALLVLVALEAAVLVWGRYLFKSRHAG